MASIRPSVGIYSRIGGSDHNSVCLLRGSYPSGDGHSQSICAIHPIQMALSCLDVLAESLGYQNPEYLACLQTIHEFHGHHKVDCLPTDVVERLYSFERSRFAVTVLQSAFRRYSARLNYELDSLEVAIVQSVVRRYLAKLEANRRRLSI
jgi:hypothetical protein